MIAWPTPAGLLSLNLKESPNQLQEALAYYERPKVELIRRFLKPGDIFLDIGAANGYFSFLAARQLNGSGRIEAFEPAPDNCERLERARQLNGYSNVTLHQVALADKDGSARLNLAPISGHHSLVGVENGHGTVRVPIQTLDGVLSGNGGLKVDVIKLDVEGAELRVLHGAQRTLEANPRVKLLIDLHRHKEGLPRQVIAHLRELGFGVRKLSSWNGFVKDVIAWRPGVGA